MEKNYTVFQERDDFEGYLLDMVSTDIWREHYAKEVEIIKLDNCPIAIVDTMEKYDIDSSLQDQVLTAMETSGAVAMLPFSDGKHGYPVNEEAFNSLTDRAGLYGKTVKIKPSVLNVGLDLNEDWAKFLVRDGMLVADHSGKYVILNQDRLFEIFDDEINREFSQAQFVEGRISTSMTEVYYTVEDKTGMTANFKSKKSVKPAVRFTTSDTSKSGANIGCGVLIDDRTYLPFGKTIKLRHYDNADYSVFRSNCQMVLSLMRDQKQKFDELRGRIIKHPQECFANIVKAQGLPIREAKEALDDFLIRCGVNVTALDIYLSLADITYLAENKGATHQKLLDIQENIARIAFAKASVWNEWDSLNSLL